MLSLRVASACLPLRQEKNCTSCSVAKTTSSSLREDISTTGAPSSIGLSLLEKKRLEIEHGPGGDHDTPYRFTLPISMPQLLAWTRLQVRVQAGELPS